MITQAASGHSWIWREVPLPNLLRQTLLLKNIWTCIVPQRAVQCRFLYLTLLGSEWMKFRSMRPFLPSPCMSQVGVTALDARHVYRAVPMYVTCLEQMPPGVNLWWSGEVGWWLRSVPAQGHLGGSRGSRLGQKQACLCHSPALELDPTLALATGYS